MATTIVQTDFRPTGGDVVRTGYEKFTTTGLTEWVRFNDTQVIVQVSGTATSAIGLVERSAVDPAVSTDYVAPVDSGFSADLTTGLAGNAYVESGVGWWRVRLTTVTAGNVFVALSGQGG